MARGTSRNTSSGESKEATAKKTASKKSSSSSSSTKKSSAKKAPANKAAPKSVSPSNKGKSKFKAGDMVMVTVNGGPSDVDMAPAIVTRGLNVVDGERVNVVAFVDGDAPRNLRNVPVLSKAPKAGDEDAPTVFALRR